MQVRCPKCGRTFERDRKDGPGGCPHCDTRAAAAPSAETAVLRAGSAADGEPGAEARAIPEQFAHYRILGEIGRGGMGIVYKAHDPELNRTVALKVLLSARHATEEDIRRFTREAYSAAKLQHPNIVSIYEFNVCEGNHYYTMDYVEGTPLDGLLERERPSFWWSLALVEKVARALEHAHTRGVIHRDLKPANIIVAEDGEPKVMDFGLAKLAGREDDPRVKPEMTRTGVVMGTPYYEAPEQAAGYNRDVDARTDVYALGCILYELLTGLLPFDGESITEILHRHIEEVPAPPRQRGAQIPEDVETICMKCLEKERDDRYPTAAALADDIRRFLDGQSIAARPSARQKASEGDLFDVLRKGVLALGHMVVAEGATSEEEVTAALAEQEDRRGSGRPHKRLGEILMDRKVVSPQDVERLLARQESALIIRAREVRAGICILDLVGYLDADTRDLLDRALREMIARDRTRIVVNGTELTYMNSKGIGVLLGRAREARLAGGDIKFFNLRGKALAVFHVLGLDAFFQIFDNEKEAVAAFELPLPRELQREAQSRFFASKEGQVFHRADCTRGRRIRRLNRVGYATRAQARAAGKRPCPECCGGKSTRRPAGTKRSKRTRRGRRSSGRRKRG